MKKLFLVLSISLSTVSFSQVIILNASSSTYTVAIGKMYYEHVFKNIKTEVSESVTASYKFDLDLQTITYNVNGSNSTKSINIVKNDIQNKCIILTYNDEGVDQNGRIINIPITIELKLQPNKEIMLFSWYNKEKNYTIVQTSKGQFKIN